MSENFSNVESLSNHREMKKVAEVDTIELLADRGLAENIKEATVEELEGLLVELPDLIAELTYDDAGDVRNENRYLVRTLSNYHEAAKRELAAKSFPSPLAA